MTLIWKQNQIKIIVTNCLVRLSLDCGGVDLMAETGVDVRLAT